MKFVFYRASVEVPLVIRPPNGMKGKIIESDVELIDIPATLLDILNINLPSEHRGKSLMPFITKDRSDQDYKHKDLIISQVSNYTMGVTNEWKFVVDSSTGKLLELYDRKNDFYENNNLRNAPEGKKIGNELYQKYLEKIIPKVKIKEGLGL
jgi:arylsulfatase A-like enzyme